MKIKMVDIAKHLGVSKATVSLAVNGKPGVNEETRRMVLECLEEMKKNNGVIPVKENIVTVSGHPVNQMIKIVIVNHSKGAACNSETDLWSDVLAAFDGVELVVDNPAPEGEEDLFGEINTESEISLNADNTHVQDVLEHALNGDKTMEEIADEWNQAWTDAQEEYDITPAPYVYGSGVAAE